MCVNVFVFNSLLLSSPSLWPAGSDRQKRFYWCWKYRLQFIFRTSWFCRQPEENLFRLRSLFWGNAFSQARKVILTMNRSPHLIQNTDEKNPCDHWELSSDRDHTIFTSRQCGFKRSHMNQLEGDDSRWLTLLWSNFNTNLSTRHDEQGACWAAIGLSLWFSN